MKDIFRFIRPARTASAGGPLAGWLLSRFLGPPSFWRIGGFVVFSIFTTTNPLLAQWAQTNGPYGGHITSFAVSPAPAGNLFAGTEGGGVFRSTNNGTSWIAASTGLTNTDVYSLVVSPDGGGGTNLFAGTEGGVWRRPLSEMITSVQLLPGELPAAFRLEQNYPNPFNPSTTIKFRLASSAFVVLAVYDLLGKQVAQLVNETLSAGSYETALRADHLSSGVYFYRLQAGEFVQTRKLVLQK